MGIVADMSADEQSHRQKSLFPLHISERHPFLIYHAQLLSPAFGTTRTTTTDVRQDLGINECEEDGAQVIFSPGPGSVSPAGCFSLLFASNKQMGHVFIVWRLLLKCNGR